MSSLVISNVFVNGTTINAAPFNTNFSAITTWSTAIDNTNIGAAGLYASQLLPTSAAQATFGGALGYTFLAPSVSTVPLTVSGVSGQTADIFDVTLTSGGTKALAVNSSGVLVLNGGTTSLGNSGAFGGGITAGLPIQATVGNVLSYVPPVYVAAGTISPATMHMVYDKITASAGTTTVTLASAAAYASAATYFVSVLDTTTNAVVNPTIVSSTQFSFTSTNTHVYQFFCIGS